MFGSDINTGSNVGVGVEIVSSGVMSGCVGNGVISSVGVAGLLGSKERTGVVVEGSDVISGDSTCGLPHENSRPTKKQEDIIMYLCLVIINSQLSFKL